MLMMLRIAFRNVFRQRRRSLLTVMTMVGGFVLSSISIAWNDGSYSYVIDSFTRSRLGHIQVHHHEYRDRPSLYRTIDDAETLGRTIESMPRVDSWAPRVLAAGLASVGDQTAGVRLIGYDPARERETTSFDAQAAQGRALGDTARHEALVGDGVAKRLQARVGDDVIILSQGADGSMANDIYTIVGVVDSGDNATDQTSLYLHIDDARELLVLNGRVHEIVIVADSPKRLFDLAATIDAAIDRPELVVEPWQVFARQFYDAMKADRVGNWISMGIIILMVSVVVLNTVLMTVLERRREYGLLRAVGTRPRGVFAIVIAEVAVLAVGACVLASLVSLGANYLMTIHGIPMPMELDFAGVTFDHMYAEINVRSYAIPAVTVFLSALIVATLPALKAARTRPAIAMRTH